MKCAKLILDNIAFHATHKQIEHLRTLHRDYSNLFQ